MLAIDGGDTASVTNGGVGSLRYRVTFKGPGGHSYGAFGLVNPAFAMGGAIARFGRLEVPSSPKTTYGVGVVRGGTSVNSIPAEVSMDVDLRSESCAELKKVNDAFLAIVRDAGRRGEQDAIDEGRAHRGRSEGHRRSAVRVDAGGRAPIVQATAAAIRAFGETPSYSDQQHRRQRPDEHGDSRRDDRARRSRRPLAFAGRVDRRQSRGQRQKRPGRARHPALRRRRQVIRSLDSPWRPSMKRWLATVLVFAILFGGSSAPTSPSSRRRRSKGSVAPMAGRRPPTLSPKITTRVKGLKSRTDMEVPPAVNSSDDRRHRREADDHAASTIEKTGADLRRGRGRPRGRTPVRRR